MRMMILIFLMSITGHTKENACAALFRNDTQQLALEFETVYAKSGSKIATISADGHTLKIKNLNSEKVYSFESNETLFGSFSPNSEFWIAKNANNIIVWDFAGKNSRVVKIPLKHVLQILKIQFLKNKVTGRKFLRIRYYGEVPTDNFREQVLGVETVDFDLSKVSKRSN